MKHLLVILISTVHFAGCSVTVNENPSNTVSTANTAKPAASSASPDTTVASSSPAKPPSETERAQSKSETKVAAGPDETKSVDVHFPAGKSEETFSGSFAGYGVVDYHFSAKGGQELTTSIVSSDGNDAILGVTRNGEMIVPGSTQVKDWRGPLPADGTYTIRVGQMRSSARRSNRPVNYTLLIRIVN